MFTDKTLEECSPSSSIDLIVYPPPTMHEENAETVAFLSNHDTGRASELNSPKVNGLRADLELEDIELGYKLNDEKGRRLWRRFSKRASQLYRDNLGLLLITAAQAFFAFINLFVKMLTSTDDPVPALELIWIRMAITYACCIAYMLIRKVDHPWAGPPGVRWLLVARGVSGFFGLFGIYYSLQYLTLSDATVLTFLSPTLTGVVSHFLLKEPFSRRQAMAGLFSLIGVVLIARPVSLFGGDGMDEEMSDVSSSQRLTAVGVSLLGVMGATGAYTSMRAIGKKAHTLHSLNFFSMYSVIVSTTLMIVQRVPIVIPSSPKFLLFLILIGVFGFFAQVLLVMGFQIETASRGTMAVYTLILFSGVLEQIVLHTKPAGLSVVGAVIIISSAVYIAFTKRTSPDGKPASKHVRWVEDLEALELRSDYGELDEVQSQLSTHSEVKIPLQHN